MQPVLLCLALSVHLAALEALPDRLVFDSDRTGNWEVWDMGLDGAGQRQLTSDVRYDSWWARPSPDGAKILFYRTPKGVHDSDYSKTSLWLMNHDASGLQQLRAVGAGGWTVQGHGEWSPDGGAILSVGTADGILQLFRLDALGANPVQLTTGPAFKLDGSWSPDGATIWFAAGTAGGQASSAQEIWSMPAAGGAATRLTSDSLADFDPYVSPDGARVAWLTETAPDLHGPGLGAWNIRIRDADGTIRRVTDDDNVNSRPQWSPDGSVLYFHRLDYAAGTGYRVCRVAPSGGPITIIGGTVGGDEYPGYLHHAPVVTAAAPATARGSVILTAEAAGVPAIVSVQFRIDGMAVGPALVAPPWTLTWDSLAHGDGQVQVTAEAVDSYGSRGISAPQAMRIANATGGGGDPGAGGGGGGGCGAGVAGGLLAAILGGWLVGRRSAR